MSLRVKSRVTKKYTIYIPKAIAEAVGLREKSEVIISVENGRIVIEPIPDPFELALKSRKYARISFEELEKISEKIQDEIFGED